MIRERRRRFTVLDAVVLIAAIGVGLAWMREFTQTEYEPQGHFLDRIGLDLLSVSSSASTVFIGIWWVHAFYNLLAAITIGVFLLRMLSPRPDLRRLTRQPGAVACGAVVATVLVKLSPKFMALASIVDPMRHPCPMFMELTKLHVNGSDESLAVFVAWLLLVCSGRWRREGSWIDQVGLILGLFWLVGPPFEWFVKGIVSCWI